MKTIKRNITNEIIKFEKIFKVNNNSHLKSLQNKHMNTDYNSLNKDKFRNTAINFKNIFNKESKYKYIPNSIFKRFTSKNLNNSKIKLKMRYMNNNISNLNSYMTKDTFLKPFINDSAISTIPKKKHIFSLSNKAKIKNTYNYFTSSTSLNDTPRRTIISKYNETKSTMFTLKEKEKEKDNAGIFKFIY